MKNKIKPSYYIGVDGGGTKTKISIMNELGKVIEEATAGPGNIALSPYQAWESFEKALLQCLSWEQINESNIHVLFGSAGTESIITSSQFQKMKPNYLQSFEIVSDAHIACVGAHSHHDGAIVIIGTGTIGYQIENNRSYQVGGWGFPYSDEGGGAWLGMQAIRMALKAHDTIIPHSPMTRAILEKYNNNPHELVENIFRASPRKFGHLSPLIFECAANNDPHAQQILFQSGTYIGQLIQALRDNQQNKFTPLPLALIGGIAEKMTPYVIPKIENLSFCLSDAVHGALFLLRKKFSITMEKQ